MKHLLIALLTLVAAASFAKADDQVLVFRCSGINSADNIAWVHFKTDKGSKTDSNGTTTWNATGNNDYGGYYIRYDDITTNDSIEMRVSWPKSNPEVFVQTGATCDKAKDFGKLYMEYHN